MYLVEVNAKAAFAQVPAGPCTIILILIIMVNDNVIIIMQTESNEYRVHN